MHFGPPGHFCIRFGYAKMSPYCFAWGTLLHSTVLLCISVPPDTFAYVLAMLKCPPIVLHGGHFCIVLFCYAFRSPRTLLHGGTETHMTPAIAVSPASCLAGSLHIVLSDILYRGAAANQTEISQIVCL